MSFFLKSSSAHRVYFVNARLSRLGKNEREISLKRDFEQALKWSDNDEKKRFHHKAASAD
jgi:hypothetical protein